MADEKSDREWMVDLGSFIVTADTAEDAKEQVVMDIGTGDLQPEVTNVERWDV